MCIDANKVYGCAMSQYFPYDVFKFHKNVILEDLLNTPEDLDTGYFIECDVNYPDNIKEKPKNFPFCPENLLGPQDKFSE